MNEKIAVFVAWPYANGDLHLGHIAGAYLPADIFSRFHRISGNHVSMISGSDSYGTPITLKAKQMGITPFELVTQFHQRFLEDFQNLGISFNLFTYTLTENHYETVREIFTKLDAKGDFDIISQLQFFDEQEQMFLPDRYVNGTCPLCGNDKARGDECEQCGKTYDVTEIKNPVSTLSGTSPVLKETEHFFFKMDKYQEPLRNYVNSSNHWRNHVQNFTMSWIEDGLKPRAITRDIDWGIPVPKKGWESKVIYVWFDAVIGYLSASKELTKLSSDENLLESLWFDKDCKSYYFIGKDNIPFHTVIWPIELMAYDEKLNLPYDVPANHFLNIEGSKFSTSRGYAVWVRELLEKISPDALRYYVATILPETKDSNFSWEELKLKNNGELVAAWGNLVNRVLGFCHTKFEGVVPAALNLNELDVAILDRRQNVFDEVSSQYSMCNLREALKISMSLVREVNKYLDERAPWTLFKTDPSDAGTVINVALSMIRSINILLSPVLPFSSQIVESTIGEVKNLYNAPEILVSKEKEKEHSILYMDTKLDTNRFKPIDVIAGKKLVKIDPLFKLME
jgi:methionyl-tRNA synthetase